MAWAHVYAFKYRDLCIKALIYTTYHPEPLGKHLRFIFQLDSDPKHTARAIMNYLLQQEERVLQQMVCLPLHQVSPHISIMESVWDTIIPHKNSGKLSKMLGTSLMPRKEKLSASVASTIGAVLTLWDLTCCRRHSQASCLLITGTHRNSLNYQNNPNWIQHNWSINMCYQHLLSFVWKFKSRQQWFKSLPHTSASWHTVDKLSI